MLTFGEYLQEQHAIQTSDKRRKMLGEGIEMTPSEIRDELIARNAKSILAQIVADNDEELTLCLKLKKSTQPMEQGGRTE